MILFHNPNEDREDERDAAAALAEPGEHIPADELWAELGLADDGDVAAVLDAIWAGAPTVPHDEIVRRYG